MAQRLATAYVKTCLQLSEADMTQLIHLFAEHHVQLQVKVTENGSQEMVFHDDSGKEIVLTFEKELDQYVCKGSCRMASPRLANVMRKAVSQFRGDAVVHRIYDGFTMEYQYARGTVVKISELRDGLKNIIYEYKDTLGLLEALFRRTNVEEEIQAIYRRIDQLLDLRIQAQAGYSDIDSELSLMQRRLFELEA
jgi:hypothetical protein